MLKRRLWSCAIALGSAIVLTACASAPSPSVQMVGSVDIPAAQGTVTATSTENNNTSIVVDVRHLAAPERVQPSATTYVVWARAAGRDNYQNLGALRVNRDLHGRLQTVTPLRSFDVIVTAEESPTVTAPANKKVLSATIER
jgi:hypothetical protein